MELQLNNYYITDNGIIHIIELTDKSCTYEELIIKNGVISYKECVTDFLNILSPHIKRESDSRIWNKLISLYDRYEYTTDLFSMLIADNNEYHD